MGMTFSQVGQDLFVIDQLQAKCFGTFLDIGCGHPVIGNNTFLLEMEYKWTGVGVDIHEHSEKWKKLGRTFFRSNGLVTDWDALIHGFGLPYHLDYISFDVDGHQLVSVLRFPWERITGRVLTIEHDAYQYGDYARDRMRERLGSVGYKLAVLDVAGSKGPFEDWWIR